MDFNLNEDLTLLRDMVRKFATTQVAPVAEKNDREHLFPTDLVRQAAEEGLMGATVAEQYGGSEFGTMGISLITEELARACASTAVTISVHGSLVCAPIGRFGSEDLKQRYLPKLASGEMLGAYALTEANAGSDAANQQAKAEKVGDKWVLNGTKLWITSGAHADLFVVFARTSQEEKKHQGITAFVVEKESKGIRAGKLEEKCGIRSSSTTEIILENCEVPESNVLGEVGGGFKIAMDTLDGGRIGIASQSLGIAQACLEASTKYSQEREQFGRPIASFQAIQWKLARMATDIELGRLLTRKAAWLRDRGEPCSKEAAMAKLHCSVMCNRAADEAVQIHGGAGYTTDFPVERYFRDARITEIYEGTTEIQHLVIAKHVLAGA